MSETRHRTAALLWVVAFLLMAGAAVWQRLTGPTHPMRVHAELVGQDVRLRLLRSATTGEAFLVSVPAPSGLVRHRRFPTSEPFQDVEIRREGGALVALLTTPSGTVRLPEGPPLVLRLGLDPARIERGRSG
jgi:hypothetical protein